MSVRNSSVEGAKEENYGEKYQYDPNFRGIEHERKCSDVCMNIFFILFFCGMLALFFYALTVSNTSFLYTPTDHRGLLCGYDNSKLSITSGGNASDLPDLTDYPYLFWTRPGKKGYARSFCVKSCPTVGYFSDAYLQGLLNSSYFPYGLPNGTSCGISANSTNATIHNYSTTEDQSFCPYSSFLLALRCFPDDYSVSNIVDNTTFLTSLSTNLSTAFSEAGYVISSIMDLYHTWKWIAIFAAAAIVLSAIWILLLRFVAGFFVWLTVLLSCAALGFLTYVCYLQKNNSYGNVSTLTYYTLGLYSSGTNEKIFEVLFWVMIGLDAIFLLILLFLCDRIKLSIGVIKIVSKVFGYVPSLFFFPIFVYILLLIWWVYVIYVAIVLFGAGYPAKTYSAERETTMVEYNYNYTIQYLSIYHFVGFLWISLYLFALSEMTVGGVFANYYFNREPRRQNMDRAPVWKSFWRSIGYNTGSLAIGSLIITICKIIRAILEYIDQKTKNSQSTFVKFILKCLKCCFWCLEKFLKYLNRNAYILIAIHGGSFFSNCVHAFNLIMRNLVRVATINWVGDFTLFLGRVFVSCVTTAGSLLLFYNYSKVESGVTLTYSVVPGLFVLIFSYFASGIFTSLFEVGIDSAFMCFMEDEERNDGSPGREMYAPEELKEHLSKHPSPQP